MLPKSDRELLKMVPNGPKWPKKDQNGPKWTKRTNKVSTHQDDSVDVSVDDARVGAAVVASDEVRDQ